MNEQIYHAIYKSPVGDLQILCTEEALLSLGVQGEQESSEIFEENALIRQIKRERNLPFRWICGEQNFKKRYGRHCGKFLMEKPVLIKKSQKKSESPKPAEQ